MTNRRCAERFETEGWMILSSRYGLLRPDTLITDYKTTFLDSSTGPIDVDHLRVSAEQAGATTYEEIEILGGREYVSRLREALRGYPVRIVAPFEGCDGIGTMMGLAKAAVAAGIPLSQSRKNGGEPKRTVPTEAQFSPAPRRPGRPSDTSNPASIRRAFELHQAHGLSQSQALERAAVECGVTLPASYRKYPGV